MDQPEYIKVEKPALDQLQTLISVKVSARINDRETLGRSVRGETVGAP